MIGSAPAFLIMLYSAGVKSPSGPTHTQMVSGPRFCSAKNLSNHWRGWRLSGNTLLLHDRYMAEIVVDPRRFRYGGPRWLADVFRRLTPALDLVILLDAPAEVLQSRKQEVSFDETRRQRQAYRAMVLNSPNGHVVDATRPVDRVVEDVKCVVARHLAERTARRFELEAAAPAAAAPPPNAALGLCGEAYLQ